MRELKFHLNFKMVSVYLGKAFSSYIFFKVFSHVLCIVIIVTFLKNNSCEKVKPDVF